MFYLKLFGSPTLTRGGTLLEGRATQRHRIALLALLATAGPRGFGRERLMAMLWPDTGPDRARNLLKASVYELRRALGADALLSVGDELRLNPELVASDLDAFEKATASGDHEAAVRLYVRPFLDGFFLKHAPTFERWIDQERERLGRACLDALEALANAAEGSGDLHAASRWWEAAAAHSPYDSRIAYRLACCLEKEGNIGGALQRAAAHARLLQTDLGISPSAEVTAFIDRLRPVEAGAPRRASTSTETSRPAGTPALAPPFHLQTLGGLGLRGPHGFVTPTTSGERDALLLLAVLGSAGTGGVPRETLLLYFRPDASLREAEAYLERLVRQARSWTESSGVFGTDPVELDPGVVGSDIGDLELIEKQGRDEDVLALGQGLFLAGLEADVTPELEEWVKAQRRRLDDLCDHASERVGRRPVAGDPVSMRAEERVEVRRPARRWAYGFAALALAAFALGVREWLASGAAAAPTGEIAGESTTNAAARDFYQQGMNPQRFRNDSIGRVSFDLFQRAVELDPDFADAQLELAFMYARLPPPPGETRIERLERGEQHARKAVALNGSLANAHAALGGVLLNSYRFAEAEESLERALELDPRLTVASQLLGQLLLFRGRSDEILAGALEAWERDPASPTAVNEVARGHMLEGRCGDALEWLDKIRNVDPPLLFTVSLRGECLRQQGSWEEAIEILRGVVPAGESATLSSLGFTLGLASRTGSIPGSDSSRVRVVWAEEARVIRDTLLARESRGRATAFNVATAYAGLGELELAIDWLVQAIEEHSVGSAIMEPRYGELRAHPRFDSVMVLLRLPGG